MKNKLTKLLLATIALALASCCDSAKGATLVYNLNGIQSGATPSGTGPWQTLTFTDSVIPNRVDLEIDSKLTSTTEFVSHICLNFDPSLDLSQLSIVRYAYLGYGNTPYSVDKQVDNIHCDGGGIFDIEIDYSNVPNERFEQQFFHQYALTYSGTGTFNANSFNFTSDKGDYVLSHIQGIDTVNSSWITTVPEPSAAILGAFGAIGLLRRRRL